MPGASDFPIHKVRFRKCRLSSMIRVNFFNNHKFSISGTSIQQAVETAASFEKKLKGSVEVQIVGDREMRKLNFGFRGKKGVTDVLSFAWQESDFLSRSEILGQIYICFPQIKRQAKQFRVGIREEFYRMLVHGLLHIVGYDHIEEKDANKMFMLQEKILKKIKQKKLC